jgi:L-seryl-tRNA(Ser) seleniumtransferase
MKNAAQSSIPSVDRVLREVGDDHLPRAVLVALIRRELGEIRDGTEMVAHEQTIERVRKAIADLRRTRIQPVINGTGIILHTNLGRAPLGFKAIEAMSAAASQYNNLEYDLATGERGKRGTHVEQNLAILCGAESATVVNNCAAALVLAVRHFTSVGKRRVVISRGELIQIGGGFRVPEILESSGAILHEVGTTNKTTIEDYEDAIDDETAMVLKVHRSNFYMRGFTESPPTKAIAGVARERKVPFLEDLGSGAVFSTETALGGEHEPTPSEVLRHDVDLVCFSGDKLLGGPQAGILAGNATHIAAMKKTPLFRALRCDKLILAALGATVDLHLHGSAEQEIPVLAMMHLDKDELLHRAQRIVSEIRQLPIDARIGKGESQIGGGSLPQTVIESVTVDLAPRDISLEALAERLRKATTPVIGYISENAFRLDLRTIFPRQDAVVAAAIRKAVGPQGEAD